MRFFMCTSCGTNAEYEDNIKLSHRLKKPVAYQEGEFISHNQFLAEMVCYRYLVNHLAKSDICFRCQCQIVNWLTLAFRQNFDLIRPEMARL